MLNQVIYFNLTYCVTLLFHWPDLFPDPAPDSEDVPAEPAFVTAFSGTHYLEGKGLIENVNRVARKNFPTARFFVFDLGLSDTQKAEV